MFRSLGRWRGADHCMRLQVDEQQGGDYSHRVHSRKNGHSAGVGLDRSTDVDYGPSEDNGFVVGQPAAEGHRGDGYWPGERHGGHFARRLGLVVTED